MFNVTIKFRLIATMAFMGIMLAVGGAMGLFGVRNSNATITELFTNQLPSLEALSESRIALLRARTAIARSIANPEASDNEANIKRVEEFLQKSELNWKKYKALPAGEDEKKVAQEVVEAREKFLKEGFLPMLAAVKAKNQGEADRLNMQAVPETFRVYSDKMEGLNGFQMKSAEKMWQENQQAYKVFMWVDLIGVLAGLIAVSVSAYFYF